jgi:hypothetical protein
MVERTRVKVTLQYSTLSVVFFGSFESTVFTNSVICVIHSAFFYVALGLVTRRVSVRPVIVTLFVHDTKL